MNCFELSTFLCDGGVIYINGQAQRIHSGDVRFSLPGDRLSSSPPFRCCTIFFQLGPEELRYKNELISAIPGYFPGGGIQTPLFRQIIEQFSSERTGSRAAQNALLLQLLLGLYALFRPESGRSGPVNRCMEYMQNHTGERVTLDPGSASSRAIRRCTCCGCSRRRSDAARMNISAPCAWSGQSSC